MKIIVWILGGLAALVLVVAVAVVLLVDPNDYKDRIAAEVEKATGRKLTLAGDLNLSLFPWLALETGAAELGNREGFGAGPFVTLRGADIGVRLLPLLSGELQVRRVELDGLQVYLVKDAAGRTNWEDLTEPKGDAQPATTAETGMPTIAGVRIKDSSLEYRDLAAGTHRRLQDLDVETGRIESGEPIDLVLAFTLDEGPDTAATAVKLKTQATLDTEAQRYQLKDLELELAHRGAGKDARELPVALRVPALDADLERQTLAAPQFVLALGDAEISGSLAGEKIVDEPNLTGSIALKKTSPRKLLETLGQEAPVTRDPKVLESLELTSKLQATDRSVALDDLKLTLDDSHVTGSAGIADLDSMAMRFNLAIDQLDLDRYQGPETEKGGQKTDEEPFELPVDTIKSLNAKGNLSIGALTLAGMKLNSVKVNVDAADGLVRVNPSQAALYGGSHRGTVTIDARGPAARIALDEQLSGIDFAAFFGELFDSKRLTGRGNAKAVLAARGNTMDDILGSLDGRIEFNAADGTIQGADLWYEIRRARSLWKREPPPAEPSTGQTRFRKLQGTATVSKGVLENRDLTIDMDHLKVAGAGTLGLQSQKLDYRLKANVYRLPQETPPSAGQAPTGETAGAPTPTATAAEMEDLKAAEIPVRVTGTLADLKIRPDVEGLAKAQAKQKVEEKKEELKEKLTDKLTDWLGKRKN